MKTFRWLSALGVALVLCATSAPRALADGAGLYLSAALGGVLLQNQDLTGSGGTLAPEYVPGIAAAAALGYELPLAPVRLEVEVSYRTTDVDTLTGATVGGTASAAGSVNVLAGMANAYLFLPVPVGLEPYLGAGVGYARVDVDGLSAGGVSVASGENQVFAYQGIAGVELDFFPGPVDIGIEYRYFVVDDSGISGSGGSFAIGYESHAAMARVRLGL